MGREWGGRGKSGREMEIAKEAEERKAARERRTWLRPRTDTLGLDRKFRIIIDPAG